MKQINDQIAKNIESSAEILMEELSLKIATVWLEKQHQIIAKEAKNFPNNLFIDPNF